MKMAIPSICGSVQDIWDLGRKIFFRALGELSIKMISEWLSRLSLMDLEEHFITQMLLFYSLGELMDFSVIIYESDISSKNIKIFLFDEKRYEHSLSDH